MRWLIDIWLCELFLWSDSVAAVQSSIENIIEAVRGKPGGIGMTMEHVRVVLEKLGSSISSKESGVLYEIGNEVYMCIIIITDVTNLQ